MPNWVFNNVTVEGSPSSVRLLKEQMNKPFTKENDCWNKETNVMEVTTDTYSNPIFSFWNIVAPTDSVEYIKQPNWITADLEESRRSHTGLDWYTWNLNNWGTKWDVAVGDGDEYPDTELIAEEENGENLVLLYKFNTAWGVPTQALTKLSSQFPDLLITNEYEEETGWGGEDEYIRGVCTEGSFYSWKCGNCDNTADYDEAPYCEDCEEYVCPECLYSHANQEDLCKEHNGSQRP